MSWKISLLIIHYIILYIFVCYVFQIFILHLKKSQCFIEAMVWRYEKGCNKCFVGIRFYKKKEGWNPIIHFVYILFLFWCYFTVWNTRHYCLFLLKKHQTLLFIFVKKNRHYCLFLLTKYEDTISWEETKTKEKLFGIITGTWGHFDTWS